MHPLDIVYWINAFSWFLCISIIHFRPTISSMELLFLLDMSQQIVFHACKILISLLLQQEEMISLSELSKD